MKDIILLGDVVEQLKKLETRSIHTVVTSPPYYKLRDYGVSGQIGLEATPEEYIETMVHVFQEISRVLRDDATVWLNIGDSYATRSPNGAQGKNGQRADRSQADRPNTPKTGMGIKPKDLMGIPWRLAFALQADGWYLRQDIIWHKPNPMPESVRDRCTKAHEYIFLLSKSEKYYFDAEAIKEPVSKNTHARISQDLQKQIGSFRANGGDKTNGPMKAVFAKMPTIAGHAHGKGSHTSIEHNKPNAGTRKFAEAGSGIASNRSFEAALSMPVLMRNKRSVWKVGSKPFKEAHFATFPPALIEPCVLAGCPPGGIVLDPFFGAGTTGLVSMKHGRHYIGIEINPEYIKIAEERLKQ